MAASSGWIYEEQTVEDCPVFPRTLCGIQAKASCLALWLAAAGPVALGEAAAPAKPEVTQHDIVPLLLLRCTVCHGARAQEGQLDLRDRAGMLRGGKSGPALVPGKPEESLMLQR